MRGKVGGPFGSEGHMQGVTRVDTHAHHEGTHLLARGLATGGLASGLLGASHLYVGWSTGKSESEFESGGIETSKLSNSREKNTLSHML